MAAIPRFSLVGATTEASYALLGMLDPRDATALRGASASLRDAVAAHSWRWGDAAERWPVHGDLASWRACFPRADAVRVCQTTTCRGAPLGNDGLALAAGARWFSMRGCRSLTNAGLAHLAGVHTLDVSDCDQLGDGALEHVAGVRCLSMRWCTGITGAAFRWLHGVRRLDISHCRQTTIDDASFEHLAGVEKLAMATCSQRTITDAAFAHLRDARELDVTRCVQLTGAFLQHVDGLASLRMGGCRRVTDAAFRWSVASLVELDILDCWDLTDAAFARLRGLKKLCVGGGTALTDAALARVPALEELLLLNGAILPPFSVAALAGLRRLRVLDITRCDNLDAAAVLAAAPAGCRVVDFSTAGIDYRPRPAAEGTFCRASLDEAPHYLREALRAAGTLAELDGAHLAVTRRLPVAELLDAVRYGGAPLDEGQRRELAVWMREPIKQLVALGVLLPAP